MRYVSHSPTARVLTSVVTVLVVIIGVAQAQDRITDEGGFQPNRDYLGLQPFEYIDTGSDNVILTFADLTLPGNAGHDLRFERVFSNVAAAAVAQNAPAWRFSINGLPMRLVERPRPTASNPIQPTYSIQAERNTTPYFLMPDGSMAETTYVQTPDPANPLTLDDVQTPQFWRYNRRTGVLHLPDGTLAGYEPFGVNGGRLSYISDQYGNLTTLTWGVGSLQVSQSLGSSQTRDITLQMDDATELPRELAYDGRTWRYTYPSSGSYFLSDVVPPVGSGWHYEYSSEASSLGKIALVRTPNGGEISYTYADREFYVRNQVYPFPDVVNVLATRSASDRGRPAGTWLFDQRPSGNTQITEVTLPSGNKVTYTYGGTSNPDLDLAGSWQLTFRHVTSATGVTLEEEQYQYQHVVGARLGQAWGVLLQSRRRVTRDGNIFTTDYTYSTSISANNIAEFHRPIRITETGGGQTRFTDFFFVHYTTPWVIGLPKQKIVTVGAQFHRTLWSYESTTGFRTCEIIAGSLPYIATQTCDTVAGVKTTYAKDSLGNIKRVIKGNGKTTNLRYAWGALQQIETPEHTTTRTLNTDGTVAHETQAGRTTAFSYDKLSRLVLKQPPGGTNAIFTEFDNTGGMWIKTTRGTVSTTMLLDGFGRTVETTNDTSGIRTIRRYDDEGQLIFDGYPVNAVDPDIGTSIEYDVFGRITRRTNPDDSTVQWTYTFDGGGLPTVTITNENAHSSRQTWRPFGHPDDARLIKVVDPNNQTWDYVYNVAGQLTSVTTGDGITRTWVYDTKFLLQSESHPESGVTTYNLYDAAGVLSKKTDANGNVFQYTYDNNDRLRQINAGSEVTSITYEPGSDNRQLTLVGTTQSSEFLWDAAGRFAGRTDTIDALRFDTRYEYDSDDNLVAIFYPTMGATPRRRIGFAYDAGNRLQQIRDLLTDRTYASGFQYHPSGAVREYASGNGLLNAFTYDSQRYWLTSTSAGSWSVGYEDYDRVGNVGRLNDSRSGYDQTFAYDALERLTSAAGPYGSIGYAYDRHGNRADANGTTYEYWPGTLRLKAQNGAQYTYDNNGNLATAPSASFAYTPHNMVRTATVSAATTTYGYDADQLRVKKVAPDGTTGYFFRGPNGELLTEWRNPNSGGTVSDYVYGGSRLVALIGHPPSDILPPSQNDVQGTITPGGAAVTVTLASGQNAYLTFTGTQGQLVSVSLAAVSPSTFSSWWDVRIVKPDGTQLTTVAIGNPATVGFLDTVALPTSGTYTVLIDPRSTLSGTVTARLYSVVHRTGSIPANGDAVNVVLATPGQNGLLTFNGTQGQQVSVLVQYMSAGGFPSWWDMRLLRPDGTIHSTISAGSSATYGFMDVQTLPATGVYTVAVDPRAMLTGTVAVRLFTVTHVPTAISADGDPITVSISTPGQNGRLPFSGVQGQLVSASMTWRSAGVFANWWDLRILKPDGTQLTSIAAGNPATVGFIDAIALPTTGTYTLVIDPRDVLTGTVDARLYTVVHLPTPIAADGAAVAVPITTPGQNGRLPFSGVQGQLVSASITLTSPGAFANWWDLRILKPDGTQLTSIAAGDPGTVGFLDTIALPSTGTYTLAIDPRDMLQGTVEARLYNVTHVATPITTDGTAVSVVLDTPGQNGRLPFTVIAGQVVSVTVTAVSPATFAPWWDIRILRPDGSQLTSATSNGSTIGLSNATLSAPGTYTLVIDPRKMLLGSVSARIASP